MVAAASPYATLGAAPKWMVWVPAPTLTVSSAVTAAMLSVGSWLAVMLHTPVPTPVTVKPDERVQTDGGAQLSDTGRFALLLTETVPAPPTEIAGGVPNDIVG